MIDDNRDRKREKEELETLRLEVMERQLREIEEEKQRKLQEEENKGGWTETNTTKAHSKPKNEDDEEEMVVVKSEVDESLPLTKTGYHIGGGFVPIQVLLLLLSVLLLLVFVTATCEKLIVPAVLSCDTQSCDCVESVWCVCEKCVV